MDLVGVWEVDSADIEALARLGQVVIEFQADGDMIYAVIAGPLIQTVDLTYVIDGDELVMRQVPETEGGRVRFTISADGVLTLFYETLTAHFVREQ